MTTTTTATTRIAGTPRSDPRRRTRPATERGDTLGVVPGGPPRPPTPDDPVVLRELGPGDEHVLDEVMAGLSDQSRYLRFRTAFRQLPPAVRRALAAVDGRRHVALAAVTGGRPIGIARYVDLGEGRAELAVEVVDAWHGRGVGTRLLRALRERAAVAGYRELVMIDAGRRIAARRGVEVEWVEADAEALPFADGEFDVVTSCVGAMFAPHHQLAADEIVRVCRPGGTIGMINWTPEGFIGHLLKTMGPYAPPPPPGATPPSRWGDEGHVAELFGDRVTDLQMRRQRIVMDHAPDPVAFREYWKRNYGPTIAVYRNQADDPARSAELDAAFLDFLTRWNGTDTPGRTAYEAEYLLVTARRR